MVIETPTFQDDADKIWSEEECDAFYSFIVKALKKIFLRIHLKLLERLLKVTNKANQLSGEELGNKLLRSVKEMKSGKAARVTQIVANEAAARLKIGLSQNLFAQALRISPRILQEWEQGRRQPSGAAKALIQIAFRHPEIIREELQS